MSKAKSVCRDWEFVSKGTEISLGKFVSEYFTPLTLGLQTGVVSTEDTEEIWEAAKEEAMEKVKGRETRRARADSPMVVETEVEKSFWLSRSDGWVINRKTKKIMLLEFKRTSDCGESYFQDMRRVAEQQHVPILTGLRALAGERGWEIEVVPMVTGQRSVREKEWLEALRIFGIGKEHGQRILGRLGRTLLDEHEKLFGSYWRLTFGPSSSMARTYRFGPPDLLREVRRRGIERVGSCRRLRTSCPLYLLQFFYHIYLVFSPYYIWICSPPPVESRTTSGKAPPQRGARLIYTRNIHRDEILICLQEVG
jgi:hypothetical protein